MRATTKQAAWDFVGAQGLQVAAAWERLISSHPEITVPLFFADAMRDLSDAADDHHDWMRATEGQ